MHITERLHLSRYYLIVESTYLRDQRIKIMTKSSTLQKAVQAFAIIGVLTGSMVAVTATPAAACFVCRSYP